MIILDHRHRLLQRLQQFHLVIVTVERQFEGNFMVFVAMLLVRDRFTLLAKILLESGQHLCTPLAFFLLCLRCCYLFDIFEVEGEFAANLIMIIILHFGILLSDVLREQLIVDEAPFVLLTKIHWLEAIDVLLVYLFVFLA